MSEDFDNIGNLSESVIATDSGATIENQDLYIDSDDDSVEKEKSFRTTTIIIFSILGLSALYACYRLITADIDWGFKINWNVFESPLSGPCFVIGFFLQFTKPLRFHASQEEWIKPPGGKWQKNNDIMSVMFYSILLPVLAHLVIAPVIIGSAIWYAVAGIIALVGKVAPYLLVLLLLGLNVLAFMFVYNRSDTPKRYMLLIAGSVFALALNFGLVYAFSHDFPLENNTTESICKIEVTGNSVNLRTGPGTNYDKYQYQANNHAVFEVIGEQGEWYNVMHKGTSVWINKRFCKRIDTNSSVENTAVKETASVAPKTTIEVINRHPGMKALTGKLDDKYEIVMQFSKPDESGNISGEYYYTKYKTPIALNGRVDDTGLMILEERTNGNLTGRFIGKATSSGFAGIWESSDGSKSMTCNLTTIE